MKKLNLLIEELYFITSKKLLKVTTINLLMMLFSILYILLRFSYLNLQIPIFYFNQWGNSQLAHKNNIFLIPIAIFLTTSLSSYFYVQAKKRNMYYIEDIILYSSLLVNLILNISLIKIIFIASSPFPYLVNPKSLNLIFHLVGAFIFTYIVTPIFIKVFKNKNLVTRPQLHTHPGMLLKNPPTRGGGFIFAIVLVILTLFTVKLDSHLKSIIIATIFLSMLGLFDDIQNTNVRSKVRVLENPLIRLILMSIISLIPIFNGVRINFISNPFDGFINFNTHSITLFGQNFQYLSILITLIWIVWVLNLLSWSNGVDGQYGGIIGISFIVISILSLRFENITPEQINIAKVAIIASGIAFGITVYNWYPSKIMWGFGAIAPGLLLTNLSIIIGSKIALSTLIILIPFLDATVTIIRRVVQRKNPLRGDRGHLHHILYNRGWGVRRISLFYWFATALFGFIGIYSANKNTLLFTLTASGIVATAIILLNLSNINRIKNNK